MNAFNYETQQWCCGEEARLLRISQLETELEILRSDKGREYVCFLGLTSAEAAIADLSQELAGLRGGK